LTALEAGLKISMMICVVVCVGAADVAVCYVYLREPLLVADM